MERQNLLSYKPKPTANKAVLPFVLTYHPDLPKARAIVNKHWSIKDSSDHLSTVFPQKPIMAYRRPKSLKDHLVRARLKPDPTDDEPLGECKPCGRSRCQTCRIITPSQTVTSSSGARVKLKGYYFNHFESICWIQCYREVFCLMFVTSHIYIYI